MTQLSRRTLLVSAAASMGLPSALARAWALDAKVETGTLNDVKHVVILMQENRSFDHYFGTMRGVCGFGDRFPIPLPGGRTVWTQANAGQTPELIAPFPLNTTRVFDHMRVEGTPHAWADAQYAWDHGRMGRWPEHKQAHAMGYYEQADIPFQWAMADAFTLCDAYHCSFTGGTNTNRLFLWTGTNDGTGKAGGPSISNSHDALPGKGGAANPYSWTTYPERLEAAGISWKVYQDMADNFEDNPLVGFRTFRDSLAGAPGADPALAAKGLATQHLEALRADVMAGTLPSVSWVVSPAADSEHPGPSSPAQGADYTARLLDCLTANPEVWARTVFLVMFDENDGYFDHVPPPAPPSIGADGRPLGASTVSTEGEYHRVRAASEAKAERDDLMGRPYGLGPRVPLYVISPWSRGGWVNSEVFDHTSVIRFLEARFGVAEPNISPWRRAVCGDLTSCFDFKTPNTSIATLPATRETAKRAAALPKRTTPPIPGAVLAPVQASGSRPSRPLPYDLAVDDLGGAGPLRLAFANRGAAAVVLHAYDCRRLDQPPRRYTIEAGKTLEDVWPEGAYNVYVYGPNGFFRSFTGSGAPRPRLAATHVAGAALPGLARPALLIEAYPTPARDDRLRLTAMNDPAMKAGWLEFFKDGAQPNTRRFDLSRLGGWYDVVFGRVADPDWRLRVAGRVETGAPSTSDPVVGGPAIMASM